MYLKNKHNRVNKKHLQKLFLFLVCGLCSIFCTAQTRQEIPTDSEKANFGLAIKSKAYNDSIVLRWAPTDGVAWALSKKKGYTLYRINYHTDGKTDTVLLTPKPIFPQTLDQLNTKAGNKNKYLAMAAQALYGKDFRTTTKAPTSFLDEVQQQSDAYNLRFFVAMQAADLSPEAAEALGFRWVDKNVKKGMFYGYIVRSDTSSAGFTVMPGLTKVLNVVLEKAPTPQGLEAFSSDKKIELQWYREQIGGFSYYFIERSDDGGKTYKKLNNEPYFASYNPNEEANKDSIASRVNSILKNSQVYFDSIPKNYVDYYYRVAGVDAFGDLSPFSDPIVTHGIDKQPPQAVLIESVVNVFQNHILIKWTDKEKTPDLAGYFVARGNSVSGPFEPLHQKLLPKGSNHFLDTTASANQKIFYVVASIDTANNYTYSIPRMGTLTDTTAPSKPTGLVGKMDKSGIIGLQWNPNPEEDIKGYRVYYSYNPDADFMMVTNFNLKANTFIDSISPRSLDRAVYYKVVSEDLHGNHSDYSDILKIDKPIVVPPTSPVAKEIFMEDGKVHIQWLGSNSEGVAHYEIFRKEKNDTAWKSLGTKPRFPLQPDFSYIDSATVAGKAYSYSAESVDETGIRSAKSFPVNIRNGSTTVLKLPENFSAVYSTKNKAVTLTWNYNTSDSATFFILYRTDGTTPLKMWMSKDYQNQMQLDQQVIPGHTYQYAIEVRKTNSLQRSDRSPQISVFIKE